MNSHSQNANDCTTSPAPTICQMLATQQQQLDAERIARQRKHDEQLKVAESFIVNALGTLFTELHPYMQPAQVDRSRDNLSLVIPVDAAALELAPFYIIYRTAFRSNADLAPECYFGTGKGDGYYYKETFEAHYLQFLFERHQKFLAERKAECQSELSNLADKLNPQHYHHAPNRNIAQTTFEQAVALDPQNAATWQARYDRMLAQFDADEREQAARAERQAREDAERKAARDAYLALAKEYAAAYKLYWGERVAVVERHLERVAALQAELDKEQVRVWELEYGILATTDDGDREVDTRSVYVLNDVLARDNYFPVLRKRGEIARVQFVNVVSIKEHGMWKPSEHKKYAQRIECDGYVLYLSPLDPRRAEYESKLRDALNVEMLPEEPIPPDGLVKQEHSYIPSIHDIQVSIQNANPEPAHGNYEWQD